MSTSKDEILKVLKQIEEEKESKEKEEKEVNEVLEKLSNKIVEAVTSATKEAEKKNKALKSKSDPNSDGEMSKEQKISGFFKALIDGDKKTAKALAEGTDALGG